MELDGATHSSGSAMRHRGTITSDPRFLPDSKEALADNLAEQANTLSEAGVDFLFLKMMSNVETALLVVLLPAVQN